MVCSCKRRFEREWFPVDTISVFLSRSRVLLCQPQADALVERKKIVRTGNRSAVKRIQSERAINVPEGLNRFARSWIPPLIIIIFIKIKKRKKCKLENFLMKCLLFFSNFNKWWCGYFLAYTLFSLFTEALPFLSSLYLEPQLKRKEKARKRCSA